MRGRSGVFGDEALHGSAADPAAAARGEQRIGGGAFAFFHPDAEYGRGLFAKRGASPLPSLAGAVEVCAGAEHDVAVAQPGQLRDAQAGVDGDVEEGVVAPPGPGAAVRRGQ